MADHDSNEKWFEGKSSLFKSRAERVKADIARRKAGRKAIKGEELPAVLPAKAEFVTPATVDKYYSGVKC